MTAEATETSSIRDRLLAALADPDITGKAGRNPATVVAFHEPIVVLEWVGLGKGLVILDSTQVPSLELATHLDRILNSHEKGLLFVAVVGGDAEIAHALVAADARARDRDQLGMYQIDEAGKAHRVAGRRLPELEKACRNLPPISRLSPDDVAGIMERGRKERAEAVDFVRGSARRFPHVTVGIIAICVLVYALTAGDDSRARQVFLLLCNDPGKVRQGEMWRLFTYALLHDPTSPTHLIVNMLSLYSLGAFLEPLLGRFRMTMLWVVSALVGGIASALFGGGISVGASGAVWGLVGATFGLLRGKSFFPALIARGLRQRLVVVLAINIVISFLPHIDRYCHFGGGLAGYFVARLILARRPIKHA